MRERGGRISLWAKLRRSGARLRQRRASARRRAAFGFPNRLALCGRHSHARRTVRKIHPPTSWTPTHPPVREGTTPPSPRPPSREEGRLNGARIHETMVCKASDRELSGTLRRERPVGESSFPLRWPSRWRRPTSKERGSSTKKTGLGGNQPADIRVIDRRRKPLLPRRACGASEEAYLIVQSH